MLTIDPRLLSMMLLGYGDSQRQLLETPILGDTWAAFAAHPAGRHALLLTCNHGTNAADLADELAKHFEGIEDLAAAQGFVAGTFDLGHLIEALLPLTQWWSSLREERRNPAGEPPRMPGRQDILFALERMLAFENRTPPPVETVDEQPLTAHARQVLGLGLVLGTLAALARHDDADPETITLLARLNERVGLREIAEYGASILGGLLEHKDGPEGGGMIWIVTTNRQVQFATLDSVPTVKGDAARQLFAIDCSDLTWAILDSGIQRDHPAFEAPDKTSRVRRTYDFGQITRILDRRNGRNAAFCRETAERLVNRGVRGEKLEQDIKRCAQSSRGGIEAVDWFTVEKLVRIDNPAPPTNPHGTHVAGILAGQWARAPRSEQNTALPGTDVATFIAEPIRRPAGKEQGTVLLRGVCPDINLHDFRVLGQDCEQTEFAVICALQFIRHLNARSGKAVIDGVNLSLSIPHDVLSYACGKTPVCLEAEKLVANGTVVVAAAGNNGYQSYRLSAGGAYDGYAFASITDPGNAETVITVGSTHRFAPHTYGVSYFSSRGPTGDGRAKPDILAPGEKIASAVPGNAMDTMDGTSMAAPHVSGAAALLMGRNREMRGDPATIKQVLCDTATDVGRIAHFQGHGLLDILRALQSK